MYLIEYKETSISCCGAQDSPQHGNDNNKWLAPREKPPKSNYLSKNPNIYPQRLLQIWNQYSNLLHLLIKTAYMIGESMKSTQICSNCTFFDENQRKCRRNPPTVIVVGTGEFPGSSWPTVNGDDWCGHWLRG